LRPTIAPYRVDVAGGGLSSDLGPLLLSGVDRQIGLTQHLTAALVDNRHASYIPHTYRDILAQRILQIGCPYEDGNYANSLRHDPMFRLGVGRLRFDEGNMLASVCCMKICIARVSKQKFHQTSQV
jgi:hypothetical protein